jgi:hypothetical protein
MQVEEFGTTELNEIMLDILCPKVGYIRALILVIQEIPRSCLYDIELYICTVSTQKALLYVSDVVEGCCRVGTILLARCPGRCKGDAVRDAEL